MMYPGPWSWRLDEVTCGLASCAKETVELPGIDNGWRSVHLGGKTLLMGLEGHQDGPPWVPYFRWAKTPQLPRTPSQPLLPDGMLPPLIRGVSLHATKAGALVLLFANEAYIHREWKPYRGSTIYVLRITPEGKVEKVERMP